MKKKAFKEILKYVRVIVFFAVITILVEAVNYVMVQPGYARYIIHTVDNPDDGSDYDCIVVGASHGRASIDPHYFLEMEYAVNPINMCIQGATVIDNYYMIREACNNNDVKKIILELDYQYWNKNLKRDSDFGDLLVYGQLPFTSLKMEYIVNQLMDKDFRTIYFRRYAFAKNWKTAKKYMAIKKTDEYKNFQIEGVAGIDTEGPYQGLGFFYRTKVTDKKGKLNPSPWTYEDLNPKVQKYFQKIVKYCKDNGIELICVTTPIPPSSVASGTANEANTYFKQICDENNVRYIDGNLIKNEILNRGFPPAVREICEAVNLKSTSSVHSHLEALEKNGYIRRDATKPRAIEIIDDNFNLVRREVVNVPIVGTVAAGQPLLAVENIEGYFPIPAEFMPNEQSFMLKVKGESMVNAGIFDGDQVLVRKQSTAEDGDIVVALIEDGATVKTFHKEKGYYRLQPENDTMDPIIVQGELQILGKVFGVFRLYQ